MHPCQQAFDSFTSFASEKAHPLPSHSPVKTDAGLRSSHTGPTSHYDPCTLSLFHAKPAAFVQDGPSQQHTQVLKRKIVPDEMDADQAELPPTVRHCHDADKSHLTNIESYPTMELAKICPFLIPGTYGVLQVATGITFMDVLELWDFSLLPCTLIEQPSTNQTIEQMMQQPVDMAILVPQSVVSSEPFDTSNWEGQPLLIAEARGLTTAFPVADMSWQEMSQQHDQLKQFSHDVFGQVPLVHMFRQSTRLYSKLMPVPTFSNPTDFIKASTSLTILTQIPLHTDILVIHFHGPQEDLDVVLSTWKKIHPDDWLAIHGRQMYHQKVAPGHELLLFRPDGQIFATPTSIFRQDLMIRTAQAGIRSLCVPESPRGLVFKFKARHLQTIEVSMDFCFGAILDLMRHAFALEHYGMQPSMIANAKRITEATKLVDLPPSERLPPVPAATEAPFNLIHVHMPIYGGGGAKQDHKQTVHAEMATLLIEHGLSVNEVPKAIDSLQRQFGIPKLTHILFGLTLEERIQQLQLICQHAGIVLPDSHTPSERVHRKFQRIERAKDLKSQKEIDPSQYKLQPGFFHLENDLPAPINMTFSPCVPGVTMMSPQQADAWIRPNKKLIPDELAIFVVGPIPEEVADFQKVVAPATNSNGESCLVAGFLVQLGEKTISTLPRSDTIIQTNDIQICAFTMWSDDFGFAEWQQIVKAPVKHARQILEQDAMRDVFQTPYGRQFRKNQTPCAPPEATSVQFHAEVKVQDLRKLLKRSGFNALYATPKQFQGKASPDWRVIWIDKAPTAIETLALPFPFTAGLVKGKKTLGLRVETQFFLTMWNHLFPNVDPPQQVPPGQVWKMTPLPYGIDRAILLQWSEHIAWKIYPMRPLGAKTWLVSSPDPPPSELLYFNGTPVIVKKLPQRQQEVDHGVIAGPKSKQSPVAKDTSKTPMPLSVFRTGDPHMDPWSNPSKTSAPSASTSASNNVQVPAGPTSTHLAQHDKQIQQLETAMQALQHEQQLHTKHMDQKMQSIEQQIHQQAEHTSNAFTTLRHDFESTLTTALAQQDTKITSSLEDLKQIFLRHDKRRFQEMEDDS